MTTTQDNARLRADPIEVLRELEWSIWEGSAVTGLGGYFCPFCNRLKKAGHTSDCRLAAALRSAPPANAPAGRDVAAVRAAEDARLVDELIQQQSLVMMPALSWETNNNRLEARDATYNALLAHMAAIRALIPVSPAERSETLPRIPGVDGQVMVASRDLGGEERRQPEWLWHRQEPDRAVTYGRWAKGDGFAPYVRADLVLAALAAAPSAAQAEGVAVELAELSRKATRGPWERILTGPQAAPHQVWHDGQNAFVCECGDLERNVDGSDDAAFIVALVNAYRAGQLVPASLATHHPTAPTAAEGVAQSGDVGRDTNNASRHEQVGHVR